jgi:2-oxoisovalerate dehydrogenase E1 component beta subunit
VQAKGLLLSSIRDPNPVLFFEPKCLYRSAVAEVPCGEFLLPLGVAEVVAEGTDITVVGYGSQMRVLQEACEKANREDGVSCELIDLQTILPWDVETVQQSVEKTGRLIVSHEAPITGGFAGEIAATMQHRCFLHLEAPILRVCGYDTPFPLAFERLYMPDVLKCYEAIKQTVNF